MKKRQTWTQTENEQLTSIVNEYNKSNGNATVRWERISAELARHGTHKTSKQCREQCSN